MSIRTPSLRNLGRGAAWLAVALLLCAPFAGAGHAEDDRAAKLEAERAKWVQEYQELRSRHAKLKADLEQARVDYSRNRSTRDIRGQGKAALVEDMNRLEKEFAEVDQELKDFPDKARRAGAFPGWFRDLDPIPAAQAGATAGAVKDAADDDDAGRRSLSDRRADRRERRKLD